jgi:hypothetical protein
MSNEGEKKNINLNPPLPLNSKRIKKIKKSRHTPSL